MKDWVVKSPIFLQDHDHILKRKRLAIFPRFQGQNQGGGQFFEVKNNKFVEIEKLTCVNLIVIMLKSLLYTNTGILIIFGAIRTSPPNRWALVVSNCTPFRWPQLTPHPRCCSVRCRTILCLLSQTHLQIRESSTPLLIHSPSAAT